MQQCSIITQQPQKLGLMELAGLSEVPGACGDYQFDCFLVSKDLHLRMQRYVLVTSA